MIKDENGNPRFFGLYRGIVFDNADPLGKGRLRLKVPQVLSDTPTQWAWPVDTASLKLAVPPVNNGVWVMFEGGDPSYPIWTGVFGNQVTADLELLMKPLEFDEWKGNVATYLAFETTTAEGAPALDVTGSFKKIASQLAAGIALPTALDAGTA